jgi:hypothetical protein
VSNRRAGLQSFAMQPNLDFAALSALLRTVFALEDRERELLILVDLPDSARPDHERWRDRRRIAVEWWRTLREHASELPFTDIALAVYPHVGSNNRDLPAHAARLAAPAGDDVLGASGEMLALESLLRSSSVVLAPTQLSATAPLKLLARRLGFRGATLPDFRREMIPTLALDWEAVDARVRELAAHLDRADEARLLFQAGGTEHELVLDLRGRLAYASGGLIREAGSVGNLPSGEAYIVPYEGERPGDPSRSAGVLPVQLENEVVLYRIAGNRAVEVLTDGPRSRGERALLRAEPAYGNLAELGLGVLAAWGVKAIGSVLLDEKLGPHIAFGRSDHFGGAVGPKDFRDPERVVHLDRVYVPECQPLVQVREARLAVSGLSELLIRDGAYLI